MADYADYLEKFKQSLIQQDCNGYLTKYHTEIFNEWSHWVLLNKPLLRSHYLALPKEERGLWPRIWAGELQSGGTAVRKLRSIMKTYRNKAQADALEDRKAAGWTGYNHKTSPTGGKYNRTGYRYGPYIRPGEEEN